MGMWSLNGLPITICAGSPDGEYCGIAVAVWEVGAGQVVFDIPHCWNTPLIIWGPPSVVMCTGMFHVVQKFLIMLSKFRASKFPGDVEMIAFQPVNLSAITRKL